MGQKIEEVLSTIIILIFDILKKFLPRLMPTKKKIMYNLEVREKMMPRKLRNLLPPQKDN